MTINMKLSEADIARVIEELSLIQDNIKESADKITEILTEEGAEIARAAYGDYPVATTADTREHGVGFIVVAGDMPLIAEFGAGDGVIPVRFENSPDSPVYPGSYSEQHAKQYSRWGFWYFGGQVYSDIPARHGLLNAKRYIMEEGADIAAEVFHL